MARIRKDLIGSVLVANPNTGEPLALLAGDKVPEGVEVGAHVLEAKSSDKTEKSGKAPKTANSEKAAAKTDGAEGEEPPKLTPPPKAGAGSSADAWRTYALEATAAHGLSIDIAEGAKREDIIEALTAVQIPTE